MLVGRERECEAIDRVLERARDGRASSLVLRGEPGVGKTELLRYAVSHAGSTTVLRATGVESEAELEYSGLLELCRPLLDELDALPERQVSALRVALGLAHGEAPDRFEVAAATLGVLATAAERAPVLVVVDDAQWLDGVSADAILFAARRLLADRVAFLVATREQGLDAHGLDELVVEGLDPHAAAQLIAGAVGSVAAEVVGALVETTGGNPLALLELPRQLSPGQLDGSEPLAGPLPVGAGIERAFAGRLARLTQESRRALGVLAASGSDELEPALRALGSLGLGVDDLRHAEDAELIRLDHGTFGFQHPLLRSVAYQDRPPSERRELHRALASAYEGGSDAERRAWHLAAAAVGPDDQAADALAEAASVALARGGQVAAARALERSARVSRRADVRLGRLAQAAWWAWAGGDTRRAGELVDEALTMEPGGAVRAQLVELAARIEYQEGSQARARELFLEAAELLEQAEPAQATRLLGLAAFTCHNEGAIAESVEIARRGRAVATGAGGNALVQADYALGRSLLLAGEVVEATLLLEGVVERLREAGPGRLDLSRIAVALTVLDRGTEAEGIAQRVVELAREEGPMVLAWGLSLRTGVTMRTGDWRQTMLAFAEGVELARQLGQENVVASFRSLVASVLAARGDEGECRANAAEALVVFERSGGHAQAERLRAALGLLELGLDRLPAAIEILEASAAAVAAMELCDPDVAPEPDLIEALVRAERRDDAERHLESWAGRGWIEGMRWAMPLEARCRGLVAGDEAFAGHFDRALELHDDASDLFQRGRTNLSYGQRLRRVGARVAAREQLRAALELFEQLEAAPWAERARAELRASGAKLRKAAESGDELTPQELQIALQVAEGKANKEVAAAMFLSPKTVEFHLSRIYRKLGIASRAELVRRFATEAVAVEV